jgi:hypothetical protein
LVVDGSIGAQLGVVPPSRQRGIAEEGRPQPGRAFTATGSTYRPEWL